MEEKEFKVVKNPAIGRNLLKQGFCVVDIKQKRFRSGETVFVFSTTIKIENNEIKKIEPREFYEALEKIEAEKPAIG